MSKLSFEEKIEIYNKRKEGETLKTLQSKYGMTKHNIQYLVWLIDKHGFDILRTTKNKKYPKQYKEDAINRVLINGEAIRAVAIAPPFIADSATKVAWQSPAMIRLRCKKLTGKIGD